MGVRRVNQTNPYHEQAHIFDRFYRAKTTRKGVSRTGLDLAICKGIIMTLRDTTENENF